MNFLSHYYVTKKESNPYFILGTVLPDLLKNHNKNWRLNPEKQHKTLSRTAETASLLDGWKVHIQVDKHFHSFPLFFQHSGLLRKAIAAEISRAPFKPFFLAHVAYELLLDSLLITENLINVDRFYHLLVACERSHIENFLTLNGVTETAGFHIYLDRFIKNRYLGSYKTTAGIVYALDRIGQRVWRSSFSETEIIALENCIENYRLALQPVFLDVFDEIEKKLFG